MLLSILNVIFLLAFLVFAYLNFNDPDAWLWVTIYLVAALCCGFAIFKKYYPVIYLIASAFYLIYAVRLFFAKDGLRHWFINYPKPTLLPDLHPTNAYSY